MHGYNCRALAVQGTCLPELQKCLSPCQVATLQQLHPGRIESVHMSYLQEQQEAAIFGQAAPSIPRITFLYKLVPGVADRSFGLNVARMAHLPPSVVDRAAEQAAHLEDITSSRAR